MEVATGKVIDVYIVLRASTTLGSKDTAQEEQQHSAPFWIKSFTEGRNVANFVHVHKHMWELCCNTAFFFAKTASHTNKEIHLINILETR